MEHPATTDGRSRKGANCTQKKSAPEPFSALKGRERRSYRNIYVSCCFRGGNGGGQSGIEWREAFGLRSRYAARDVQEVGSRAWRHDSRLGGTRQIVHQTDHQPQTRQEAFANGIAIAAPWTAGKSPGLRPRRGSRSRIAGEQQPSISGRSSPRP